MTHFGFKTANFAERSVYHTNNAGTVGHPPHMLSAPVICVVYGNIQVMNHFLEINENKRVNLCVCVFHKMKHTVFSQGVHTKK